MKKFLLSTLIGTTLMSTMAGGSLAFAEVQITEGGKNQTVQVSYESIPEIATSTYIVSIPETIKFTSDKDGVDLQIDLFNKDGGVYSEGNGVDIAITSTNTFKLKNDNVELPYSLTYEKTMFNGDNNGSKIHLGKEKTKVVGTAKINATTSVAPGKYSDTLTYNVKAS